MRILHLLFVATLTVTYSVDSSAQAVNDLFDVPGSINRQEPDGDPSSFQHEDLVLDLKSLKNRQGQKERTRKLIHLLGSERFQARSRAEKMLTTDPDISLDELIAASKSNSSVEVRFRVHRILKDTSLGRQLIIRNQKYARIIEGLNSNVAISKEIIPLLFEVAELLDTEDLLDAACQYVFAHATNAERGTFHKNLKSGSNSKLLAIYGLGKVGSAKDFVHVAGFLKSGDVHLVMAAAHMLSQRNDRQALSVLIRNLTDANQRVRVKSIQILRGWTGLQFGMNPYKDPLTQKQAITEWNEWFVQRSNDVELKDGFQLAVLPEDLDHGLLVHYSFDKFVIGKFQNSVDRRFTGLTRNSVDSVFRGKNRAIRFHGAGKHGSRGGHALIDAVKFDTLNEFTIALWVKETGLIHEEGESYISFGIDGGVGREESLGIAHFNGLIIFRTGKGEVTAPYDLDDRHKWIHYAMTFKKGVIIGYRNGELVGRAPGKINVKSTRAALARHWWGNGVGTSTRIQASMDDVRIYKRALLPDQMKYLVNSTRE